VDDLEQKYPRFRGLNVTWEVREGLMKHAGPREVDGETFPAPSLEAQVANLADEIAYYSHDLDDGLGSGLLQEKDLRRDVEIWAHADRQIRREHGALADECRRFFIVRCLIDEQVTDVVTTTEHAIHAVGLKSADDARRQRRRLVQYSAERQKLNRELRAYLYKNLYYNPEVHVPNLRAVQMLEKLFRHYLATPKQLPPLAQARGRKLGWPRAVCDYISGMTDRYAMAEFNRLFAE
jgi:dGTPase